VAVAVPEKYINKQRVEFYFYSCLLMVSILTLPIFLSAQKHAIKKNKHISILKTCAYECRKDRVNAIAQPVDFSP